MAMRTKQIALDEIQGTFREQYKRIYDYGYELLRRIYVCLEACKQSFQHCRSFIGLDRCFLKTPQGGQLLTAIGWDSNDQMLPIAYAVVEVETKDSWIWFLNHLASDIGIEKMKRSTFMSDQQKSLLPTYEDVILGVDNRFCVRHLYSNFRKRFPGLHLKQMTWKCAKTTHWKDSKRYMAELKTVNQEAFRYLIAIPPRYWSRSRFTFNSKVDTLVNMSESFNSAIVDAREKSITKCVVDEQFVPKVGMISKTLEKAGKPSRDAQTTYGAKHVHASHHRNQQGSRNQTEKNLPIIHSSSRQSSGTKFYRKKKREITSQGKYRIFPNKMIPKNSGSTY
ncbi:uncharacterized protein [Arachis hypogaea]|uniref:uncharacterized protein n=1 Tax=Arachis hypogaea TaxID=3818 RepID=UPI003B22708B